MLENTLLAYYIIMENYNVSDLIDVLKNQQCISIKLIENQSMEI